MDFVAAHALAELSRCRRPQMDRSPITMAKQEAAQMIGVSLRTIDRLIALKVDLAIEFQTYERIAPAIAGKFRAAGIPFIAAWTAVPGATSGAHIHVGQLSPRIAVKR